MNEIIENENQYICIPLEEYKELLQIKGKYEELKEKNYNLVPSKYLDKNDPWFPIGYPIGYPAADHPTKSSITTYDKE